MLLESLILGSVALNAVVTLAPDILGLPRAKISNAVLASLGVVTDIEYLTLTPTMVEPFMEITLVEVKEDPVPGVYAKVWVSIRQTRGYPSSVFVRIIDDDTGTIVGYKKNFITTGAGDSKVVKYDGFDDWNTFMPNRVWNLRIETGTN